MRRSIAAKSTTASSSAPVAASARQRIPSTGLLYPSSLARLSQRTPGVALMWQPEMHMSSADFAACCRAWRIVLGFVLG
eukprot:scaffold3504_cov240-Pinguiococcus_pyrenoidosus.AAC.36